MKYWGEPFIQTRTNVCSMDLETSRRNDRSQEVISNVIPSCFSNEKWDEFCCDVFLTSGPLRSPTRIETLAPCLLTPWQFAKYFVAPCFFDSGTKRHFLFIFYFCVDSPWKKYIYILLASANSSHWNYLSFRGICTHHVTLQNMSSTHVTFLRGKGREINASTAIVSLSKLDTYTVEAVRQREKSFTAEAFHKLVTVLLDARCCGTEKFRQQDGTAAIAWNRASGWQFVRYWYCRVFKFTPR